MGVEAPPVFGLGVVQFDGRGSASLARRARFSSSVAISLRGGSHGDHLAALRSLPMLKTFTRGVAFSSIRMYR
jgi:hypothetical protein